MPGRLQNFWFREEPPHALALVRILLGLALAWDAARHWPYAVELYSTAGFPIPAFDDVRWRPPVPWAGAAVALSSLQVFAWLAVAAGWCTRWSLAAGSVTLGWLALLDLPGTFAKYTAIALHACVWLFVSRCGDAWSVDTAWRGWWRDPDPRAPCWPRRLLQLFVCSVYLSAGLTKISTDFASGELLHFALLHDAWGGTRLGYELASSWPLTAAASLATLLFELWFPILVWFPRGRRPMLAAAVAFHAATGLLLDVGAFSPVMLALLPAFLEPDDLRFREALATPRAWLRARSHFSRRIGWLAAAAGCLAVGVTIQVVSDRDGALGIRRPAAPKPLRDEVAADWLNERQPADGDWFHRIDLGQRVAGVRAWGKSDRFRRGEKVWIVARLVRPHPAVEWSGTLLAPDGSTVAEFAATIEPATLYAARAFELTETLPPGAYRIVFLANGYEFAERRFEIVE